MIWLIYMDLVALYKGLIVKTSGQWPLHQPNFAPRMEINIYGRTLVPPFNLLAQLLAYIQIWQRWIPIIYCKQCLISIEDRECGARIDKLKPIYIHNFTSPLHQPFATFFSHIYGHMYRKPENIINQKWTIRLKEVLVQENNDSSI